MRLFHTTACAGFIAGALLAHAVMARPAAEGSNASLARATVMSETDHVSLISGSTLVIPVADVLASDLADTWGESRSEGRRHEGIDIMAPLGTPVRAVADGRVVKFFDSEHGGITIYQFDQTERFVYYYAHLSRRAPGLAEGDTVRQGQLIGYVGMTGNAPVPHLHFEIQRLTAERHWWEATSLNPYAYLMTGQPPS